jgi:hypothetical protein
MAPLLLEPISAPRVDDSHGSIPTQNGAANEGWLGMVKATFAVRKFLIPKSSIHGMPSSR